MPDSYPDSPEATENLNKFKISLYKICIELLGSAELKDKFDETSLQKLQDKIYKYPEEVIIHNLYFDKKTYPKTIEGLIFLEQIYPGISDYLRVITISSICKERIETDSINDSIDKSLYTMVKGKEIADKSVLPNLDMEERMLRL